MEFAELELILGKPLNSEHKSKISAALKKWWKSKKSEIVSLIPTAQAKPKMPKNDAEAKKQGDDIVKRADELIVAGATAIDLLTGTGTASKAISSIKKSVDELTNNREAVIERMKKMKFDAVAKRTQGDTPAVEEEAKKENKSSWGMLDNINRHNEELEKAMRGDFKSLSSNFEDMLNLKEYSIFNSVDLAESDLDNEFELISTAKQTDSRYGEFAFSKANLQEMADNLNNNVVGTDIPVDKNHDPDHLALAWMANGTARVAPSKKLKGEYSLYSKIDRHTPTGKEVMSTGAYRYFSLQIQSKMEKIVNGVKKTFSNVVRSLALTNQPVIKDLAPTFSENILHLKSNNIMDLKQFLELADNFLKQEKVSAAQITTLKTLSDDLEGEDKTTADAKVEEAEAKVEEEKPEPKEEEPVVEKPAEEVEKELAEKLKDKKTFDLSEVMDIVKTSLKPVSQKLNEVITEQREKVLADNIDSLCLSADKTVGYKTDAKKDVLAFVKTLSDVQATAYFELHSNIIDSVDLSEQGSGMDPAVVDANTKVQELAEAKMKENEKLSLSEAMAEVLSENKDLADKAGECKQY